MSCFRHACIALPCVRMRGARCWGVFGRVRFFAGWLGAWWLQWLAGYLGLALFDSACRGFSASVGGGFALAGGLGTGLLFYGVRTLS